MPSVKRKKTILWLAYGLSAFVLLILQTGLFNRFKLFGAGPLILPVCVAVAAVYEGAVPAAVFGICCGFCMDSLSSGQIWIYTAYLAAAGWCVGEAASYTAKGALFSCVVWSLAALLVIALGQTAWYGVLAGGGAALAARIAAAQTVYSLVFSVPICFWFRAIHKKLGDD